MTPNIFILVSFLASIAVIMLSALLVKAVRKNREKARPHDHGPVRRVEFELKGDIFELDQLSVIMDDLVRYQVPVKTILDLNIILEEVFTGIISRQPEDQPDKKVHFTLIPESKRITSIIRDNNAEFNPVAIPKIDLNAPLEEISFQGLGFHMIRKLADQISYQRQESRNVLTVKKNYPES